MRKVVKRWGSSLVIVLNKEDIKSYEVEEGDIMDIIKFNFLKKRKENGSTK